MTDVLNNFTWSEINQIGQAGYASQIFSVGDVKTINANGESIDVKISGFNHDGLPSGGKAPISFCAAYALSEKRSIEPYIQSNVPFVDTYMYEFLTDSLLPSLDSDLQSVIKEVTKKTRRTSGSPTIRSDDMKIFLLSNTETGAEAGSSEGNAYPLFTSNSDRMRKLNNNRNGQTTHWWLRSPFGASNISYRCIHTSGIIDSQTVDVAMGVVFGFCV